MLSGSSGKEQSSFMPMRIRIMRKYKCNITKYERFLGWIPYFKESNLRAFAKVNDEMKTNILLKLFY